MKKIIFITLAVIFTVISSCSNNDNDEINEIVIESILSQQEIDDLKFLREEEKLARDVYLYSYDKYGNTIFNNISNSEQQHMDSVLTLLNKYGIDDPALSERGKFSNQILQGLYNDLTALSDKSLIDALTVGAIIEDLDIKDIEVNESRTSRDDILIIYNPLGAIKLFVF